MPHPHTPEQQILGEILDTWIDVDAVVRYFVEEYFYDVRRDLSALLAQMQGDRSPRAERERQEIGDPQANALAQQERFLQGIAELRPHLDFRYMKDVHLASFMEHANNVVLCREVVHQIADLAVQQAVRILNFDPRQVPMAMSSARTAITLHMIET